MFERANTKAGGAGRTVKLPGKTAQHSDARPVDIARELRAKSELGLREAQLARAEAKLDG
ncbi:hypothetical protein GGE16_002648 [Rhizobium leguminosarum]|uniref:Uncharacterized protein n=1 Tax=Rhizobium leguminosarum TaxID=384 RepID=A0AAE2SXC6_RHILE|nr:hypothetical protein [Rhizobium leguminosarum]MBB4431771.1 hypothetical protein [Rhizobium esperanzae]MBB4297312.1 hypothetical protein [Rhizobium leguminosarum]MBB4307487.1 hypothetical protein [Rhizobium leguminosarum]MBB4415262.1 hypothetical protein [Rhizobium leguminosarum]